MVTFDQFFNAIAQQESGGDYGAVNSRTGASGKYQIMPANIGPWSQQYLGYRVSVDQFRNDPGVQDRLARAVLSSYYNQYGARGAAAAWYSGSPSNANNYTQFNPNEPSIGDYVDSVLGKAGTAPGGAFDPQTPGRGPATGAPPSLNDLLGGGEKRSSVSVDGGTGQANIESAGTGIGRADGADAAGMSVAGANGPDNPMDSIGVPIAGDGADAGVPDPTGAGGGGGEGLRQQIISLAEKQVGTPYVWGGAGPGGFDCSGLVQWAYGNLGISLPRVSYQQANAGRQVPIDQLKPGDLVAWDYSGRNQGADHIAIYAGNGNIIEAPQPGQQVRVRPIYDYGKTWGVSMDDYFN